MTNHPNLPQLLRKELLTPLEDDIRDHSQADEEIYAHLRAEHQRAKDAGRTAHEFGTWRDEQVTLSAVQWILGCVFIRFCEDTDLIAEPRLAGEGERLGLAEDATTHYFAQNPSHSDREYLLWVFAQTRALPGMGDLFDPAHNPLYKLPPSVDGADLLLSYWRQLDTGSGELALSFADPKRDTRFLGDLYQDLSEDAKKRYALLQTPEFVESFILDHTLEPAIDEFGLANTDLIDPACGSGHFLLGAFDRLLGHWRAKEPQASVRALCQRTLDQIAGVDINPFAIAIAEFRLLVAALNVSEIKELKDAPDFQFNLATGDSLLHGQRPGQLAGMERASARAEHQHLYEVEDEAKLRKILDHGYAAVVANPPYIRGSDPALRQAYRDRFEAAYKEFALSVPFTERILTLAREADSRSSAGFVGQITSNSFMKREFGKKLIEDLLPRWDLTQVIDTSGAYIPGHATPTVIMFARARAPVSPTVDAILGVRGEPGVPDVASEGRVWLEILSSSSADTISGGFVTFAHLERAKLGRHPWSLQGGGMQEVVDAVERQSRSSLSDVIAGAGFVAQSNMDEIAFLPARVHRRLSHDGRFLRPLVRGDLVRDWGIRQDLVAYFPYVDQDLADLDDLRSFWPHLWRYRSELGGRRTFSKLTYVEEGRPWWAWHQVTHSHLAGGLLTFAHVATHNHFAMGGSNHLFNRSAPVLSFASNERGSRLIVASSVNTSTGAFWMKQRFHEKGTGGIGGGIASESWELRYEHDATKLKKFPLPDNPPTELACRLDELAQELGKTLPAVLLENNDPSSQLLAQGQQDWVRLRQQLIALQEELDWRCYYLYGLIEEDLVFDDWDRLPRLDLGERVFEITLARRVEAGETETRWFERHGSQPITEIPSHLPEDYQALQQRRLDAIESNKSVRLIERPEYKRRWMVDNAYRGRGWKTEGWESMLNFALRAWIGDRLESTELIWTDPPSLLRSDQISDKLLRDEAFQEALGLYAGSDADPAKTVAKLLAEESVPYLCSLRYKPSGIRKREAWERTWELQRAEDRGETVEIDVPPKYKSSDFLKTSYWRQRGKLDVPKERFISYPGAGSDGSELYGWAGWDHVQRARALATRIAEADNYEGKDFESVIKPLLAGLEELLPWVKQWNPDVDPEFGQAPGDTYEQFLEGRVARHRAMRGELGAVSGRQAIA